MTEPVTPAAFAARCQALLEAMLQATDTNEKQMLEQQLREWLWAYFQQPVRVSVTDHGFGKSEEQ